LLPPSDTVGAMSERHEDPGAGRSLSTGEFRAAPDISANTAQFQAFASATEPDQAWDRSSANGNGTKIALIVVGVIVLLAIIAVIVPK
jgi:hypothetical protein